MCNESHPGIIKRTELFPQHWLQKTESIMGVRVNYDWRRAVVDIFFYYFMHEDSRFSHLHNVWLLISLPLSIHMDICQTN